MAVFDSFKSSGFLIVSVFIGFDNLNKVLFVSPLLDAIRFSRNSSCGLSVSKYKYRIERVRIHKVERSSIVVILLPLLSISGAADW